MHHAHHSRTFGRAVAAALACCMLVALLLLPAAADPVAGTDEFPRVAFVARNDVPFDSLALGPVAGALGGIVVITSPSALSSAARDALVAYAPDLVVIAGGSAAISPAVEAAIDAAGPWTVARKAGAGRDQTAAALATLLTDLAMGRPALSGGRQIVDDVTIGGTLSADALAVQSTGLVANLNADRLDDKHAADLASRTESATFPAVFGLPSTVTGIGSVTIEAPVAGTITAHAHANVVLFGASTVAHLGIALSGTELDSNAPGVSTAGLLDGADTTRRRFVLAPLAVFEVAAGTHTIHLNGARSSVFDAQQVNLTDSVLSVTFVPAP
jgi:hypothetical protein